MVNSFSNEIVRLVEGVGTKMPSVTNTKLFIPKGKVTAGSTVTYGRIMAEIQPQKYVTHRALLTVGGNIINLPGEVTKSTKYITTSNLIFNSVLLTKNEKFMCHDIKHFYLKNPMDKYEYMKLQLEITPAEIIQQ